MERPKFNPDITVKLVSNTQGELHYPDGRIERVKLIKEAPKSITETELIALSTMRLVIPIAFFREVTAVNENPEFRIEMEEGVVQIGDGIQDAEEALIWAGSVLQRNRSGKIKSAYQVAKMVAEDYGINGKREGGERERIIKTLEREIKKYYPGSQKKKIPRKDKYNPSKWN